MQRSVLLAVAALLLSSGAAHGASADWASATVSPARPARAATLTVSLHYEMTCGRPGAGPLVLTLPRAMQVGPSLTVRSGTRDLAALAAGRVVTVQLPEPTGVTCMSIAPGVLKVSVGGLRNPARPGTYTVRARIGPHTFTTPLAIRS